MREPSARDRAGNNNEGNNTEGERTSSPSGDGAGAGVAEQQPLITEPDPFDEWWALYPHKVDKKVARERYAKALKATDAATLLDGLQRWITYWEQAGQEALPYPSTWLNKERWNEVPQLRKAAAAPAGPWRPSNAERRRERNADARRQVVDAVAEATGERYNETLTLKEIVQ